MLCSNEEMYIKNYWMSVLTSVLNFGCCNGSLKNVIESFNETYLSNIQCKNIKTQAWK